MKFAKHFKNSVPYEKWDEIYSKVIQFCKDLEKYKSFKQLPRGYYVRNVEGTDIYKFRINDGDRILYYYDNLSSEIIILEYCKHDDQIRRAKKLNNSLNKIESYKYKEEDSIEDIIDNNIDDLVRQNYSNEYLKAISQCELDDTVIGLGIESDDLQDKKYLTIDQFHCIEKSGQPIIILGCAGSGKSLIGIKRLVINNNLKIKSAYITNSVRLKNSSEEIFNSMLENENKFVEFKTIEEICLKLLGKEENQIMDSIKFDEWLKISKRKDTIPNELTVDIIWNEINSIIKGKAVGSKRLIALGEYENVKESKVDKKYRKYIHILTTAYDEWIEKSSFLDKNDLCKNALENINEPMFKCIVYDEVQELNYNELRFLKKINETDDFIFLGDTNQRISHIYDNTIELKDEIGDIAQIFLLDKNYRSGKGIVQWINKLKSENINYFGDCRKISIPTEIAIRDGNIPDYINHIDNLSKLCSKIGQSTNSIIVVGDQNEKMKLSLNGYDTSRVFTIEESRGIEYKQVFCLNLMSYAKKTNSINSIYIGATRSKKELTFIELLTKDFENIFKESYNVVSEKDMINNIKVENSSSQWIIEADKLKKAEKYLQAADAYKKAGYYKEQELCIQAYEKQRASFNLKENNIYIDIHAEGLDISNLVDILKEINKKYKITLKSWIEVNSYHISGNVTKTNSLYIGYNKTYEEISKLILSKINMKIMKDNHILLNIERSSEINFENDITIEVKGNNIYSYYNSIKGLTGENIGINVDLEGQCNEYEIKLPSEHTQIQNANEVKNMSADDSLGFIFGKDNW